MVRHRPCAVLVVLFVVVAAASAQAHHSFSGAFDINKRATLKGVISKIDWVNPHVYIHLDVKDNDGKVATWAIESLPTNHLRNAGITRNDLWNKATEGEMVTVHVYESKDVANHRAGWLLRITYADGHFLHLSGDPNEIVASQ
ncbi:MAG: hypothetical protein HW394_1752 [Acidobacteria bacterium]|nr:hypothetical protein [Acidobacteriota bacterium]